VGARGWVFTAAAFCHFNPDFTGILSAGRPKKGGNHIPVAKVGLKSFTGWGMRITFVDNDRLTDNPIIEVKDPDDDK
jgi:hypothetical protein